MLIAGYRVTDSGQSTIFWAALNGTAAPTICSPVTVSGGLFAAALAAAFDTQGRLLLAGDADFSGSGEEGIALRYLYPACDLDATFNGDGIFRTDFPENTRFEGLGLDSQLRVALGGHFSDNSAAVVVRLTASGQYDVNFDTDGHLEQDLGGEVRIDNLLVQPDSRILIAGRILHPTESYNFVAARFDSLGDLDTTFSGDGIAQVDFGGGQNDSASDLALDPNTGGILLAGNSRIDGTQVFAAVARLTAGGALDSSWSGDGRWTHSFWDLTYLAGIERQSDGPLNDITRATALSAGKLVVAGFADTAGIDVGIVARLWINLIFADDFERGSTGGWSQLVP